MRTGKTCWFSLRESSTPSLIPPTGLSTCQLCLLVVYQIYLSIRSVYQSCLSDLSIRPVYAICLSDLSIRLVYQICLSALSIRPVYQICLSVYQTCLTSVYQSVWPSHVSSLFVILYPALLLNTCYCGVGGFLTSYVIEHNVNYPVCRGLCKWTLVCNTTNACSLVCSFPPQLKNMLFYLCQVVNTRYPDESTFAVGTVVFLRFINPALGK